MPTICPDGFTPFDPVDPTGISQPIYIVGATIDGQQAASNDWIGIFDGGLCVGQDEIPDISTPIVVWIEYPTGGLPGATEGNLVSFQIYDTSTGDYLPATVTVISGSDPPVFQQAAILAVELSATSPGGSPPADGLSANQIPTVNSTAPPVAGNTTTNKNVLSFLRKFFDDVFDRNRKSAIDGL